MARTIATGPAPPSRAAVAGSRAGASFGEGISTGIERGMERERRQEALNPFLEMLRADVERSPFVEGGEIASAPPSVSGEIPSRSEFLQGSNFPRASEGVSQEQAREQFQQQDPRRALAFDLVQNPERAANFMSSDVGAQVLTDMVEGRQQPEDVTRITGLLDAAEQARGRGESRRAELLEGRARSISGMQETRQFQTLGPDEAAEVSPALGEMVGQGAIVQRDDRGKIAIEFEPDDDQTQRDRKINDFMGLFGMSRQEATKMADGLRSVEINPQTGRAVSIDQTTGAVSEIPLGESPQAPNIPRDETLFSQSGDATGAVSGAQSIFARIPFTEPTEAQEEVLAAREDFNLLQNDIARSLANNPRFPVREREAIISALDFSPQVFDNPAALRSRMGAADRFLRRRLSLFERDADDPNLPEETRAAQASNASAMRNAIAQLGVPQTENLAASPDAARNMPEQDLRFIVDQMDDEELSSLPDDTLQAIRDRLSQ